MNQRTHAWIAVRAVALLEDEGSCPELVNLLKPLVKSAAVGAWIPDKSDAKIGGADTDNHVLKMAPYNGLQQQRFILPKQELLNKLGAARAMHTLLKEDTALDETWWGNAYKADPQPGQHIADRAGALTTAITDLLIMGDADLAELVPGRYHFAEQLADNCRTRSEQAALYFYMQSHFVADACMPCHCDARKLSSYSNGLHKELEAHWSKKVGAYFDDEQLQATDDTPAAILNKARERDAAFAIHFTNEIPELIEQDVWLEMIYVCRGSFAIASIIAPPDQYEYGGGTYAPFEKVLEAKPDLLAKVDQVALHDAVLNVAVTWKYLWTRLYPEKQD
jgi:hypothetical protein